MTVAPGLSGRATHHAAATDPHDGAVTTLSIGARAHPPFAELAAWQANDDSWQARCEFDFGEGGRAGFTAGMRRTQDAAFAAAAAILSNRVGALGDDGRRSVSEGKSLVSAWLASLCFGPDGPAEEPARQEAPFIVDDASTWTARGNSPAEAAMLAAAWRDFPDLPNDRPLDERRARTRARMDAMRPVFEARQARAERERHAHNFAFVERKLESGRGDEIDIAALRGRDSYGYDWDQAITYATGWYASHAGWDYHRPTSLPAGRDYYDRGFRDAGGRPDDLFDAAKRSLEAEARKDNQSPPVAARPSPRPLPSDWDAPSDRPRPAAWPRRLIILACSERQIEAPSAPALQLYDGDMYRELRARGGHEAATIIILSAAHGFVDSRTVVTRHDERMSVERAAALACDIAQRATLRRLVGSRDYDDVLIAAPDTYLPVLDAHAAALPLARSLERTKHSLLLQRRQLRTWLDRSKGKGENLGSGHIRWGKAHPALTAKLGEFTARYVGPAHPRGHLIRIELVGGNAATGYVRPDGTSLAPELVVSSRAKLRTTMGSALREFAGCVRFGAPVERGTEVAPC